MGDEQPKVFCDEQLGKLSRWLRIIGVDAEYCREIPDEELLRRAREEGRTVFTRDRGLCGAGDDVVCLSENYPAHQLREVVEMYRDRLRIRVFERCAVCNGRTEGVKKSEVEGKVPPFVFKTQEKFTRCTRCGRVYWQATHRERVERQLGDMLGELYHELKDGKD